MQNRSAWIRSLIIIFGFTILGWSSARLITPIYQAEFSAIILRPNHEFTDFKPEQNFNRWVWARDGLSIQEGLVTDEFLAEALRLIPELNEQAKSIPSSPDQSDISTQKLSALRSKTEILFGGAESQLFTLRFKHTSPVAAVKYVEYARDSMRNYFRANSIGSIESAIKQIDQQLKSPNKSGTQQLARIKDQLESQLTLQSADFSRQFRVIKQPQFNSVPIWPKPKLLAAVGILLGLFTVSIVEWIKVARKSGR
jgi:hypothetical protein